MEVVGKKMTWKGKVQSFMENHEIAEKSRSHQIVERKLLRRKFQIFKLFRDEYYHK